MEEWWKSGERVVKEWLRSGGRVEWWSGRVLEWTSVGGVLEEWLKTVKGVVKEWWGRGTMSGY